MTVGQWFGQWFGSWYGSGEPAPAGAMSGAATVSLSGSATPTAIGALSGSATVSLASSGTLTAGSAASLSGTAAFSFTATGTLTSTTLPVGSGDYQFFAQGFWSAGFFSDGFWGVLEQPYNELSYRQQLFVRTLLERTYVTTTVDYIVTHAQHFSMSVLDSVEAIKVLTKQSDLRVMPEVKREAKEEKSRSARKEKVDPRIFVQTRMDDLNVMLSQEFGVVVESYKQMQVFVNTGKNALFVVESGKL